ncbi:hypothetical protein BVX97_01285 [bacterium E08(2017)]|nr:hypothetical protein BVX97_01285 [bacterium E08(2017)]
MYDPVLFGADREEGLVAVDFIEGKQDDQVVLHIRKDSKTESRSDTFRPFIITEPDLMAGFEQEYEIQSLKGEGLLNELVSFADWKTAVAAKTWLAKSTGVSPAAAGAPYLFVNDPVQQYLMTSGKTLFKGMAFEDLHRMQVDIECTTSEGYEFCNADRKDDEIIAIAIGGEDGSVEVLSGIEMSEKEILERFVEIVAEQDPDVIEGHNIFNFDIPYIVKRAKRHKVKLALGRDGSVPKLRPSRFSAAERTISYKRCDIFGRHVVDTLFMVHVYDISHRSLNGFGLKEAAIHFGFAAKDRVYIEGSQIAAVYREDPKQLMEYVTDDVEETRALSSLLSRSYFVQASMLPYGYQNTAVRGNATKINALMIREYLRQGTALPEAGEPREFAGGYTDMFETGVIENVHHCDVRSLYPSLMLSRDLGPKYDELGAFLGMLDSLKSFRLEAKKKMGESKDDAERNYYDALQTAFKVLINSFYGYLGFTQGHFNDFAAAEQVTAQGRELLRDMIGWLQDHGAKPIEIDTDGIYFVPPSEGGTVDGGQWTVDQFRAEFQKWLPDGIEIEFDGEYRSMYSYKMKNYALLDYEGEVTIKGGALKSRGLEPFQREFLEQVIRLKLEGKRTEIPALKEKYDAAIRDRSIPLEKLAKTETLQDAPSTYEAKRKSGKKTPKRAAYELALKSAKEYRAGDQVSYYVTGEKKSVAVYCYAKALSDWDGEKRDENVPYYLAKLETLYKKFGESAQQELF